MNQTNPNQQILTLNRFLKRYVLVLGALFLTLLSNAQGANPALIDITVQETAKAGNDLDNWTVNNASRVFYVAPGANGSGTSINDPMSMDQAFSANQVQGGDWYWVKAGDYGMKNYDLSNLDIDATRFNPIAWVGYRTTPGDIVSQPYGGFNTAPNTNGKHSNPMANLPTNSAGHHILDSSLMPTITGNQGNAPDYLDNDYAFESDGGEEGYIFKNFQVQFMAAGWFIKNPKYWLFDNIVSAHMGNFQYIEGQGGSNQELRGEGIQFEYNGPAGNNCVVKNSFFAQHAIKALSFGGGTYNLAKDVAAYSDINEGNPQDYYFHTTGKYNNFLRVRALRNINSRHSGHGICFNYGAEHNMAEDSYIYGTAFHFDASFAGLSKNNTLVKEPDWCQYITNDPDGNNSSCYSGGGYAIMDDANNNMVDGGTYSGAGFLDSQAHSRPDHASSESAGHSNTFKNAYIVDLGDAVFSAGSWSGTVSTYDNLIFNNIIEGSTAIDVARPNSGFVFRNNDMVNLTSLWEEDNGFQLNENTCFINNKWVNSAVAEQDARTNFCFVDDGDPNGADLDSPPDPPNTGASPVITLIGDSVMEINVGDTYTPPGSTAMDAEDGPIEVVVTSAIDTNTAGTYYEYHNATDSDGNLAQTVTRTIRVLGDGNNGGTTNGNRFVGRQALFSAIMIDSIKNRIENGYRHPDKPNAFINDVAYLVGQSNAFFANSNAGAWDNWSVSGGVIQQSAVPMPSRGVSDQIHYAGIRTFFQKQFPDSANIAQVNADKVMDRMLQYARSDIQPEGLNTEDTFTSPYMFISLKMSKFVETYSLVEAISSKSATEKQEIESWFASWGMFFKQILNFSSTVTFGPNWQSEDYISTSYNFVLPDNSLRTNPINGNTGTGAQQTGLNNVRAHIMGFVHTYGVYFNDQESKDMSYAWFKMLLQLNHYADGTSAEMVRSYPGNQNQGLTYNMVNLTAVIKAAITEKIANVNGLDGIQDANKYFNYLTTKGTSDYSGLSDYAGTSTSGGNKTILRVFKNHLDYKRQAGNQGHSPQRRLAGDLMDGGAKMTHRPAAAVLAMIYNDDELDAAVINDANYGYTQNNLTSGSNTGGYPHTLNGAWNSLYGMMYYVDIEGAFDVLSSGDPDDTGDSGEEEPDFESVGVDGLSLSPIELNMSIGDDFQLLANVLPTNASNKNIFWTSSNSSVVSVDQSGRLIGLSEGTAIITAQTEDGGFQARSSIQVFPRSNAPFQLFMINEQTQAPIATILQNSNVSLASIGTSAVGIVAVFEDSGSIQAINFSLTGEIETTRQERVAPYSLFGDNNGVIAGRQFSLGTYSIEVRITYLDGSEITETINFEIVEGEEFIPTPVDVGGYQFTIAPNPAVAQIQVSFPFAAADLSRLTIFDMSGKVVQSISPDGLFTNGNLLIMNVSHLRQGIYIISSFSTNYGSSTQKLIVQ